MEILKKNMQIQDFEGIVDEKNERCRKMVDKL